MAVQSQATDYEIGLKTKSGKRIGPSRSTPREECRQHGTIGASQNFGGGLRPRFRGWTGRRRVAVERALRGSGVGLSATASSSDQKRRLKARRWVWSEEWERAPPLVDAKDTVISIVTQSLENALISRYKLLTCVAL